MSMADDCELERTDATWRQNRLRFENAQLRAQLKRCEESIGHHQTLMREADHRIKNSLQILASLLRLQAARADGNEVRDALAGTAERIRSIGVVHDALQASGGEDAVELGAAIGQVCGSLQEMAGDPGRIAVYVVADLVWAPAAYARPVMLMANELILNALRHGFPDGRAGTIRVGLSAIDDQLLLAVTDDGVGIPDAAVESRGYGLKLSRLMAAQVAGSLSVDGEKGVRATLRAPAPPPSTPILLS
jgi:two-component sensor histidine kinase